MADLRERLFTWRSYTPIPFLIAGLVFGVPSLKSIIGGAIVALFGEIVRFWGVGHIGSESRVRDSVGASKLVVTGPFRFVRNPLYVGNILLYTGLGIMANLPWLTIATLVWFLFQYTMIVSREEEFLSKKFGDQYQHYKASVWRFMPRLTPYDNGQYRTTRWKPALKSERRTFQALAIAIALLSVKYYWLLHKWN